MKPSHAIHTSLHDHYPSSPEPLCLDVLHVEAVVPPRAYRYMHINREGKRELWSLRQIRIQNSPVS